MGIPCKIISAEDSGDVGKASRKYGALIRRETAVQRKKPVLFLAGGEHTVRVKGKGKGGRNQEFILRLLKELSGVDRRFTALSIGTDGQDGPTEAAGAWIDQHTMARVKKSKLNLVAAISNNDSFPFFKKLNQLIVTGPTGTNVMDLRMFYVE